MIAFKRLRPEGVVPKLATTGSAGFDLTALSRCLLSSNTTRIPTGLAVAIPSGYVGLIRPRSSLFARGLEIEGVIDSDYRGEVYIMARSKVGCVIEPGERIAQLVVVPCMTAAEEVEELGPTARGVGGFGSSGR